MGKVTVEVLKKFGVENFVRAITADSASVNTAMFRILEREGYMDGFNTEDCHVRCMGHIINLAVQALLKELQVTAGIGELDEDDEVDDDEVLQATKLTQASYKVRQIIKKIRSSNQLWESFQAQAKVAKISPKRPILDMPVRWNSTYSMLERCLELRTAIDAVCRYSSLYLFFIFRFILIIFMVRLEERLYKYQISVDEWVLLQQLKDILDIFVQATEHLSGSNYPTLSAQLPFFSILATRIEQVCIFNYHIHF